MEHPKIAQTAKHAILSFVLACSAAGRADVVANFRHKVILVPGLAKEMESFFSVIDEPSDKEQGRLRHHSQYRGSLAERRGFRRQRRIFIGDLRIPVFGKQRYRASGGPALMTFYERIWPEILANRTFSMRSPLTNGPIILAAIRKGETAMQRMANMVLATRRLKTRPQQRASGSSFQACCQTFQTGSCAGRMIFTTGARRVADELSFSWYPASKIVPRVLIARTDQAAI